MRHNPHGLKGLNLKAVRHDPHEQNEPWVQSVMMKTDQTTREVLKAVRHDPHERNELSLLRAVRHDPHDRNEH